VKANSITEHKHNHVELNNYATRTTKRQTTLLMLISSWEQWAYRRARSIRNSHRRRPQDGLLCWLQPATPYYLRTK